MYVPSLWHLPFPKCSLKMDYQMPKTPSLIFSMIFYSDPRNMVAATPTEAELLCGECIDKDRISKRLTNNPAFEWPCH